MEHIGVMEEGGLHNNILDCLGEIMIPTFQAIILIALLFCFAIGDLFNLVCKENFILTNEEKIIKDIIE